jgi:exopolyphosphatase/pppGpp-phosphohydrolase
MNTDHSSLHQDASLGEALVALMGGIPVDDLAHAQHVMQLALDLFQITWPLHGFGPGEAELLRRAALLHDAGILISFRGHHKASLRLIQHATLPGLTTAAQMEVACIARYHRKALPRKSHAVYGDLSRSERQRVDELGGILRLADAFDYEHDAGVSHLSGHVLATPGKASHVLIHAGHHITDHAVLKRVMEQARKKSDLFERALQCRVSISPELALPDTPASAAAGATQLLIHNGHQH